MKKLLFIGIFQFVMLYGVASVEAQTILTEQQLQEKIRTNKILTMYLVDAGITGFQMNLYGSESDEFIVRGSYEEIPNNLLVLAREHNVRVLPSQLSKNTDRRFWLPMVIWLFNMIVLFSILVTVIIINKRISNIEKLIKK